MNISYTLLKSYRECPLQYKWRVFGSPLPVDQNPRKKNQYIGYILQTLVERFYKEEWWRKPLEVLPKMRTSIGEIARAHSTRLSINWFPGEYENWLQVAQDTVEPILKVIKKEKLLVPGTQAEYSTVVPLGDKHQIFGRIDFVYPSVEPDGYIKELTVIDGKGGKQYGKYTDKNQLLMYGTGVFLDKKYLRFPTRTGFWFYRHAKIQWHKFTKEHYEKFLGESILALDRLVESDFEPTPSSHCRLCDFCSQCDAGIAYMSKHATQLPEVDVPDNLGVTSLDSDVVV